MDNFDSRFEIPLPTTEEINKIIKNLNPKKATGPDKIPPKIAILSANVIDAHLTNIITQDLISNCYAEKAKTASVRPTYKKKDRDKIENYRPVSILNCFSKVYERYLHDQFKPFVDTFFIRFYGSIQRKIQL